MSDRPERNLALELVRVTEAAALAAAHYMGTGDKEGGDRAAVNAMRLILGTVEMDGVIVIGEGEKDQAPMLYNGERVGNGRPPAVDVAVDPVEGTRLLALGRPNALSVIALAERWSMWNPGPSFYMEKLVVGKQAREAIDLRLGPAENLHRIAEALGKPVRNLTVFVLDKPRHEALIREIRATGARVSLQTDGDVAGALMACLPGTGIDVLMGVGGTPEGVLAATAVKATGSAMQCRRAPQSEAERARVLAACGETWDEILTQDDLVRSEDAFFAATGITAGALLQGVRYEDGVIITHSLVMRVKTGTIRYIKAIHQMDKLARISSIPY
ncbi:MAG: class II fructose-bisphosphatase [Caldilineales bacterium]|nr:class II fructose-bisphosphatase [Caldilineales bacterium]